MSNVYKVKRAVYLETRAGKQYCALQLLGERPEGALAPPVIDAKVWGEGLEASNNVLLEVGQIIAVKSEEQQYEGKPQLIVNKYALLPEERRAEYAEKFVAKPAVEPEETYKALYLREWSNPEFTALFAALDEYLKRTGLYAALLDIPGGAKIHHARRAGLLQHVQEMFRMAQALLEADPPGMVGFDSSLVNREVVYAGILFHDVGKIHEYHADTHDWQPSLTGNAVGHLTWAAMFIFKYWPNGGSEELRDLLLHAVVAHHGSQENGSPVTPRSAEAVLVSGLDLISAKLDVCRSARDNTGNGEMEYSRLLKGRPLVRSLQ